MPARARSPGVVTAAQPELQSRGRPATCLGVARGSKYAGVVTRALGPPADRPAGEDRPSGAARPMGYVGLQQVDSDKCRDLNGTNLVKLEGSPHKLEVTLS